MEKHPTQSIRPEVGAMGRVKAKAGVMVGMLESKPDVSLCPFLLILRGRHDHPSRCLQGIRSLSSSGDNQHSTYRRGTMNKCLVSTAPTQPPSSPVWVQIYSTRSFFGLMGVIKDNSSSTSLFTITATSSQFGGFPMPQTPYIVKAESVPYFRGRKATAPGRDQWGQSSA